MGQPLTFYDLRAKKSFKTSDYIIETRNGRRFAVAQSPDGNECWKTLPKGCD